MKDKQKRIVMILFVIVLVVFIIVFISKGKKNTETKIENNIATSEVEIENVTFSEIKKIYEGGVTTVTANMKNNTKKTKNFTIKIVMKDEAGKEVQSMTQIVENLEAGKTKRLSTGILGDYSNIKDIQFEVID